MAIKTEKRKKLKHLLDSPSTSSSMRLVYGYPNIKVPTKIILHILPTYLIIKFKLKTKREH